MMERWALLVGVALNGDIDILREIEMLLEQPQRRIEEFAQPILALDLQKAGHCGSLHLGVIGLLKPVRLWLA